ncbi:hypothetical protein [Massilia sp. TN1-12]|uniref:hypothetical protein n=1 Tax=Massilia paldalensis TaxID=3377675 RepID=UPI00384E8474
MRPSFQIACLLAGAALAAQAGAAPPQDAGPAFDSSNAVAAESLDGYRGGFVTDTGLAVSLGLERITTINGAVADSSKIDFGDLGKLTAGQATLSADSLNQLRLIQNGGGGSVAVDFGPNALGGTVIQNSLNNQIINNSTIINASVDARGLLQSMNFQNTLSNALNSAATGR